MKAQQPLLSITLGNKVPTSFFGMSVNKPTVEQSGIAVSYGTTRTWDVYPFIDWAHSNPSFGVYDFTNLDAFIAANAASGNADIIYTLGNPPLWASAYPDAPCNEGPGSCGPPGCFLAWNAYIAAVVSHTRGKIHIWELWNEPQDPGYYAGNAYYMALLAQQAQQVIKSIDPSAIILSPAPTGGYGPAWMNDFLSFGGGNYVDVIAFHGYWSANAADLASIVQSYRAMMTTYGIANKPLWDTESSWAGGAVVPTDYSVRAAYVAQSYLLHWSLGVSRFVWYMYDNPAWGGLWDPTNGIHPDGTAYAQVSSWMIGAVMSNPCGVDQSGTWTCDLVRSGGYGGRVVWNANATPYQPASQFTQLRTLTGLVMQLNPGSVITLGNLPVLLETGTAPAQ